MPSIESTKSGEVRNDFSSQANIPAASKTEDAIPLTRGDQNLPSDETGADESPTEIGT